jgi:hypothetical protein
MDRLTEQQAGNKATARWANQVVDELRRQHLIPGNGIRVTVTGSGTVIALDIPAEASSSDYDPSLDSCFPVYITRYVSAGNAYEGIRYRVVGKNYSNSSGDEGESNPIYFPHVTPQTTIPMGCTILAHRIAAPLMQDSIDS